MRTIKLILIASSWLGAAGCQGFNPVVDTARAVFVASDAPVLYQSGFEYLQVQVDGRQAAMALGQRRNDGRHTHEYWYSSQREMLYLQNGRIHQVMGMTHEVREQRQQAPDWAQLAQSRMPFVWQRTLDVQPGYRYGVQEDVVTQRLAADQVNQALVAQPADWFEDIVTSKSADGRPWHYRQVFAVVNHQVVYSEQCVAPRLCLTLRYLGVVKP